MRWMLVAWPALSLIRTSTFSSTATLKGLFLVSLVSYEATHLYVSVTNGWVTLPPSVCAPLLLRSSSEGMIMMLRRTDTRRVRVKHRSRAFIFCSCRICLKDAAITAIAGFIRSCCFPSCLVYRVLANLPQRFQRGSYFQFLVRINQYNLCLLHCRPVISCYMCRVCFPDLK